MLACLVERDPGLEGILNTIVSALVESHVPVEDMASMIDIDNTGWLVAQEGVKDGLSRIGAHLKSDEADLLLRDSRLNGCADSSNAELSKTRKLSDTLLRARKRSDQGPSRGRKLSEACSIRRS